MGMIRVTYRQIQCSFSPCSEPALQCWPLKTHSAGRGNPLWALCVPSCCFWVRQEFKAPITLPGRFLRVQFGWIHPGVWEHLPKRAGLLVLTIKAANLPSSKFFSCITTVCKCEHPGKCTFVARRALRERVQPVQTWCSAYCFWCKFYILVSDPGSSVFCLHSSICGQLTCKLSFF